MVLIGKIASNGKRQRLLVSIEDHKGVKAVDVRIYNVINDGELVPTQEGLFLAPDAIETLIGFLREAKKKLTEG